MKIIVNMTICYNTTVSRVNRLQKKKSISTVVMKNLLYMSIYLLFIFLSDIEIHFSAADYKAWIKLYNATDYKAWITLYIEILSSSTYCSCF